MAEDKQDTNITESGDSPEDSIGETGHDAEGAQHRRVGERLADERRKQGIDLTAIGERTRVPLRHLEAIEKSDFAALPGITYALGFARSYARALGMDASAIGSDLRSELSESGHDGHHAPTPSYEPADPSRVPPRALAWSAAGIAALLLIGYLVWRSLAFDGTVPDDVPVAQQETGAVPAEAAAAADAPDPSGDVVLTATDTVWVRIYDGAGKRLYEKEMQKGEAYTVPADADNPMINTGRAQAIDVTIGGKKVESLGPADLPILDVGVSAEKLLSRGKEDDAQEESNATAQ